tara:strand:+ start:200 stop:1078 length:879 start_codon:yes stop_codon:yes gene_type:complete
MLIGIFSAFGATLAWTYACSIWRKQTNIYKPIEINFLKNIIAFIIFSPVILILKYSTDYKYFLILICSGIIGIGLGDTFYLKSLNLIGTRKTLSIEALSPLIAAIAGNLFLDENLNLNAWIGIVIVTGALVKIIKKKSYLLDKDSNLILNDNSLDKYIYSFLSVFCAVIAALLSRFVFLESDLAPIFTTEIRLFGSIIFLCFITKMKLRLFISNFERKEKNQFILSVLMGTNIGILLQQIVFQSLPIGIGWTLLSTSPIVSLLFTKKEEGILTNEIIIITFLLFIGVCLILL